MISTSEILPRELIFFNQTLLSDAGSNLHISLQIFYSVTFFYKALPCDDIFCSNPA